MGEMVASAVVQEVVSGAVSFVCSSRSEKASQEELMERLEMAHIKLHVGLERTKMMPITIMPLLRLRKKLKDVFTECDDLLGKARDHQQVVPSLRRKIMHTVLPSFIVPRDVLSSSVVGRFERFVKEAIGLSGTWSPDVHFLTTGFSLLPSDIFLKARVSTITWCKEARLSTFGYGRILWKSMAELHR